MKKILLVDDSVMMLRLGKKLLEPLGVDVSVAESAEIALEMASQEDREFDLVIIDYDLGKGMNGIELGVEIKDLDMHENTPLIMLSGSDNFELKRWCNDAGFSGCYKKGLEESTDFLHCVTDILSDSSQKHAA